MFTHISVLFGSAYRHPHPRNLVSCGDYSRRLQTYKISKQCERPSFLQLQCLVQTVPSTRQRQLMTSMREGGPAGPGSTHGEGMPAFISHPCLVIFRSDGVSWSAAFHIIICREARCTCRNWLVMFGGRFWSLALPFFCEYRLYLTLVMDVPGFWPYSMHPFSSGSCLSTRCLYNKHHRSSYEGDYSNDKLGRILSDP